jgi:hypothetical protein
MNELQEFFQSVAIEKKKVAEEQARIQAREERLKPQVKIELNDLSEFFGTVATSKRNLSPKTIQDVVTPVKQEQTKMHLELESFFDRLSSFENALEEQITKPKDVPVAEVVEAPDQVSQTQLLADAMSKFTKGVPETITEEPTELDKIKEEFRHFKETVIAQMASIGGGGEVNLLKLDDVDTGAIGNGKVLSYNASTGKLQFVTSSGGASNLQDLSDVDTTNLADDSIMQYNSSTGKFEFTNELDGGTV